ncbi:MAG: redoxin domain-containing protein [Akkermansiaceae bacterium]|nr:redoxin domain-containing protein [Armatimonadota bacterium]
MNQRHDVPEIPQATLTYDILSVGSIAPDFTLDSGSDSPRTLHSLRGQPVIVAFSSTEWDPAHAEQMTNLYNALVATTPDSAGGRLTDIRQESDEYALGFAGNDAVTIPVLQDLDRNGAEAESFGVRGKRAVFVLDAQGIVRWSHVAAEGTSPRVNDIVSALQAMQPGAVESQKDSAPGVWQATRRDFIAAALAGAIALAAFPNSPAEAQDGATKAATASGATLPVNLNVNGKMHRLNLDSRVTLLDALREHIGLTGSKKGCDHGQCGACTVHIDGDRALSCLALAAQQEGSEIVTIEGLAKGDELHPVQQAFLDYDGYQCGYCTPGQIMSAVSLIREGRAKSDSEIREGMSGNLCRCAAYPHILAAVKAARDGGKRV